MPKSSPRPSTPTPRTTATATTSTVPSVAITHPAHALLARSHSPTTAARVFTEKIQHKPLLLAPTAGTRAEDKRALRRHIRLRKKAYFLRKQKPQPLSAKEKRQSGLYEIDEAPDYAVYKGLNELWNGYMLEVLGLSTTNSIETPIDTKTTDRQLQLQQLQQQQQQQQRKASQITAQGQGSVLASADFHGAELEVMRCVDVGKVGLRGIVVRETKFTFVLVTPSDELRTVMKKGAVFRYRVRLHDRHHHLAGDVDSGVPARDRNEEGEHRRDAEGKENGELVFELHGSQFEFRPAERANRKFKWRAMDDV